MHTGFKCAIMVKSISGMNPICLLWYNKALKKPVGIKIGMWISNVFFLCYFFFPINEMLFMLILWHISHNKYTKIWVSFIQINNMFEYTAKKKVEFLLTKITQKHLYMFHFIQKCNRFKNSLFLFNHKIWKIINFISVLRSIHLHEIHICANAQNPQTQRKKKPI